MALCTRLKVKKPHETEERKKGRKGESRGAKSVSVSQSVGPFRFGEDDHFIVAWPGYKIDEVGEDTFEMYLYRI